MKQVNQVGVDVDSEELVCAMQRDGQRLPLARFANTVGGHTKFIRWVTKGARPARVTLPRFHVHQPWAAARLRSNSVGDL